ncbi:RDD family protein [Nocardioides bruguierae]|uniref:RDD family protein n=1 Tax=Nocardioides bruguierae TaxID=2945102 RepID=A0A9X2D7K2_9ACTN|nr:RDD family protein [Nocardioides bruguierae]MCM0619529.1 RDD family protein [Nocardioides bruguierae]
MHLGFETATWPRRMLALAVDWIACLLVTGIFMPVYGANASQASGFVVLGVFVLESAVMCATAGGSFGQLVTRLRVVRVDGGGRPLTLLPAIGRQLLVALVIPPLVFKPDGRGLHDLAVGSAVVELGTFRSISGR